MILLDQFEKYALLVTVGPEDSWEVCIRFKSSQTTGHRKLHLHEARALKALHSEQLGILVTLHENRNAVCTRLKLRPDHQGLDLHSYRVMPLPVGLSLRQVYLRDANLFFLQNMTVLYRKRPVRATKVCKLHLEIGAQESRLIQCSEPLNFYCYSDFFIFQFKGTNASNSENCIFAKFRFQG